MNNRFTLCSALVTAVLFSIAINAKAALPDFTKLVKKSSPAVVNISTQRFRRAGDRSQIPPQFRDMPEDWLKFFFNQPERQQPWPEQDDKRSQRPESLSAGSGFVISKDGYIVTNHHVVDGADKILVRFNDLQEMTAELIGSDERTDIALLKVESKSKLQALEVGNSEKLEVGEWVIAIGAPFGFDYTVTAGIVSAKRRSLPNDLYVPFIQTDVAINPGNSGGPLLNLKGKVVGVNSQIYSRSGGFMGLSFAIPSDLVLNVVEQLKTNGEVKRGFLGVQIQEVTSELSESFNLAKPEGALVAAIFPNTPAEEADIEVGDIIIEFNGQKIRKSYELPPLVGITPVNKKVKLVLLRNGKKKTLSVTIAPLPDNESEKKEKANPKSNKEAISNRLGVQVSELPDNIESDYGVYVVSVMPDSPADIAGLVSGDVLLKIERSKIKNVEMFKELSKNIPERLRLPVLILRDGRTLFTTLTIR